MSADAKESERAQKQNSSSSSVNDRARRLLRNATETIKRLDDLMKRTPLSTELFSTEAIILRNKLKEVLQRLLFTDPLHYGVKAEELLWRKVFYEVIQVIKHKRKENRPIVQKQLTSLFVIYLTSATSFYRHLLLRLQREFDIDLTGVCDWQTISIPEQAFGAPVSQQTSLTKTTERSEVSAEVKSWAHLACHRCLVCLGDLARYLLEHDHKPVHYQLSERYYLQAYRLCPKIGMPHNQLGTLVGNRYLGLDAVFHYLYCMVCDTPFEGAQRNLKQLLSRNERYYNHMVASGEGPRPRDTTVDLQRSRDIKRLLTRFMYLLGVFLGISDKVEVKNLHECCQTTLQQFDMCMYEQQPVGLEKLENRPGLPLCLDDSLVMKIVLMCMMAVHWLRKSDAKQVMAATAFTLALFSYLFNHTVIRIQAALDYAAHGHIGEDTDSHFSTDLEDADGASEKNQVDEKPKMVLARPHKDQDSNAIKSNESPSQKSTTPSKKSGLASMLRRRRRGDEEDDGSDIEGDDDQVLIEDSCSDLSEGNEPDSRFLSDDSEDETHTSAALLSYVNNATGTGSSHADSPTPDAAKNTKNSNLEEGTEALEDSVRNLESVDEQTVSDSTFSLENRLHLSAASRPTTISTTCYDIPSLAQLPDTSMSEYLKNFGLSGFGQLYHSYRPWGMMNGDLTSPDSTNLLDKVCSGAKSIAPPPGFDEDPQTKHIEEIAAKMSAFTFETDTDTAFATTTDTEAAQSSDTASSLNRCVGAGDNNQYETEDSSRLTNGTADSEDEGDETSIQSEEALERTAIESALSQLEQHYLQVTTVGAQGLLKPVRLACMWLQQNLDVVSSCAESCQSLWARMSVLLNLIPLEADIQDLVAKNYKNTEALADVMNFMAEIINNATNQPSLPCEEDRSLYAFPPLVPTQKKMVDIDSDRILSNDEQSLVRMMYLRQFGYSMALDNKLPLLTWDDEEKTFIGPLQALNGETEDPKIAQEQMANSEARRNQLMKDMAQLRLQAEVNKMETIITSPDGQFSPYLVPDTNVLCDHMSQLKKMIASGRFIIVVPIAGIRHLDIMKRENPRARMVIRWLESEFRRGKRYVRAQEPPQKKSISGLPNNLRKLDKDAWHFSQLLSCAMYLVEQSTDYGVSGGSMVTIVTTEARQKQIEAGGRCMLLVKQSAKQEDIPFESIEHLYARWFETWNPTGS